MNAASGVTVCLCVAGSNVSSYTKYIFLEGRRKRFCKICIFEASRLTMTNQVL